MAHAFPIGEQNIGFNLDRGEEMLVIAAYVAARPMLGAASWLLDFERNFFEDDKGVTEKALVAFNSVLRHAGNLKHLVKLSRSRKTHYMAMRGTEKTEARVTVRKQIEASRGPTAKTLSEIWALIADQEAPGCQDEDQDRMFAEAAERLSGVSKFHPRHEAPAGALSPAETARRAAALSAAPAASAVASPAVASPVSRMPAVPVLAVLPVPGIPAAVPVSPALPVSAPLPVPFLGFGEALSELSGILDAHARSFARAAEAHSAALERLERAAEAREARMQCHELLIASLLARLQPEIPREDPPARVSRKAAPVAARAPAPRSAAAAPKKPRKTAKPRNPAKAAAPARARGA